MKKKHAQALKKVAGRLLPVASRRRKFTKVLMRKKQKIVAQHAITYPEWIAKQEPSLVVCDDVPTGLTPQISIIVPCYNTPQKYYQPLIDSVINQTYSRWQLCLADGSTDSKCREGIQRAAAKDDRIIYVKLKKNLGIAGNTNEGIKKATGTFIAFLDHDDLLPPWALQEVVRAMNENPDADLFYSDEDYLSDDGSQRLLPFFKPGWSLDLFLSVNYLAHFVVVRKSVVDKVNCLRLGFDGAQDYDFLLRVIEHTRQIIHIPKILYHWRMAAGSTAKSIGEKNYADEAGRKALGDYLMRNKIPARVIAISDRPTNYRLKYDLPKDTFVSIIVPFRDKVELLKILIPSILNKTTYKNYEIILLNNNSVESETFDYLNTLRKVNNVHIYEYNNPFNYSAINNFGRKQANGSVLIFLNNDTEVINNEWLEELTSVAIQKDRGAVGAMLQYPDGTLQHAGVVLGMSGAAGHVFRNLEPNATTFFRSPEWPRNYLAVTGACMAVEAKKFDEVKGFNEKIIIAGSDVVLCLELYEKGYKNVYWPHAQLTHFESKSVGSYQNIPPTDYDRSISYYRPYLNHKDPYYNPNFELLDEQPQLRRIYDQ